MNTTWADLGMICKSLYGQDSLLSQFWDISQPRFPSKVLREIERVLDVRIILHFYPDHTREFECY